MGIPKIPACREYLYIPKIPACKEYRYLLTALSEFPIKKNVVDKITSDGMPLFHFHFRDNFVCLKKISDNM